MEEAEDQETTNQNQDQSEEKEMTEPRRDLINHLRDQIQADPEAYANEAKLKAIIKPLAEDIAAIKSQHEQAEERTESQNPESQGPTHG